MRAVFIGALLSSQLRSVVRMQLIASFGRLDKGPPPINIAKQTAQQVIVIARIAAPVGEVGAQVAGKFAHRTIAGEALLGSHERLGCSDALLRRPRRLYQPPHAHSAHRQSRSE